MFFLLVIQFSRYATYNAVCGIKPQFQ